MRFLKQSTSVEVKVGPFLDETDGKTAETALTISQGDIRLAKNDGDWAQSNDTNGATHEEAGWYRLTLNATDTNTLGILMLAIHESGALPVWVEFHVLPANIYDSWFSTDLQQVDAREWAGASTATDDVALVAAPSNFAALAITAAGKVTVGTNDDKTGYTVSTVSDKTGYSLASSGLDAIAVTDPGAPASHTTIPKMVVALWRWFYKKTTLSRSTGELKTYADNGSTVNATATCTDDGATQTKGALS